MQIDYQRPKINEAAYTGLQRDYRNAVVTLLRERFTERYNNSAEGRCEKYLGDVTRRKENRATSQAKGSRNPAPLRDSFELIDLSDFGNILCAEFNVCFPRYSSVPKAEKQSVRDLVLDVSTRLAAVRNNTDHPETDEIDIIDCEDVLRGAKQVSRLLGLEETAAAIQGKLDHLLSDHSTEVSLVDLPPDTQVVVDFVGRSEELSQLRSWLPNPNKRIWFLRGDGGLGKSSIAYEFTQEVAKRHGDQFHAVIWMSAKKRRFQDGTTVVIDRPDFKDKASAVEVILRAYGSLIDYFTAETREDLALALLKEFPAFIVADDIDSLEGEDAEAASFLHSVVPNQSKSKVLCTTRREVFGFGYVSRTVKGLDAADTTPYLVSRCQLLDLPQLPILREQENIRRVCDGSPLYMEDLLRFARITSVEESIKHWAERGGDAAREYAIKREFDLLDEDSRSLLMWLGAIPGGCRIKDLQDAVNWHLERFEKACAGLREMFLMPDVRSKDDEQWLHLSTNTRKLISDVFGSDRSFKRAAKILPRVQGKPETNRSELFCVKKQMEVVRKMQKEQVSTLEELIEICNDVDADNAAHAEVFSTIGWLYKEHDRTADAREAFDYSIKLSSTSRDGYYHLASLETIAANLRKQCQ